MTKQEIITKIKEIKAFGNIPRYHIEKSKKFVYIWENNGQIPETRHISILEKLSSSNGYATFIGRFKTTNELNNFLKYMS